jgi:hypothetical protein
MRFALAIATCLLLAVPATTASPSDAFTVVPGYDAVYTLFVNDADVTLNISLATSAYALLGLDGPGDCFNVDLGSGASPGRGVSTHMSIDCGHLPLGWYRITIGVQAGLAHGILSANGGTLRHEASA